MDYKDVTHTTVADATSRGPVYDPTAHPDHGGNEAQHALAEFCKAVLKSMRGVKVCKRDHCSAFVYRPEDAYVMGWIGFGDYVIAGNGTSRYAVYAPDITNNKYRKGSTNFHMQISLRMPAAVKAAKNTLRSYTAADLAHVYHPPYFKALQDASNTAMTNRGAAVYDLGLGGVKPNKGVSLWDELQHLYATEHVFLNPETSDQIGKLIEAHAAVAAIPTRNTCGRFVYRQEVAGVVRVHVAHLSEITSSYTKSMAAPQVFAPEEVPEEIQGAVAILSMFEDGHHVPDVGFRVNADTFFVPYTPDAPDLL
jgi:hypothetical protein